MVSLPVFRKYQHLNKILVSRSALEHNYRVLADLNPNLQIAPVLKSNAYGHGLKLVASIFDKLNPPFFMVDSLYEAYEIRKLKLKTPVLIMGYTHPNNLKIKRLPFHFAVFDLDTARALNSKQRNCPVHLFIDTGMHREGVMPGELPGFLSELKKLTNLRLVGLASHLADADSTTGARFTEKQLQVFEDALEVVRAHGFDPQWRHVQASAGVMTAKHPALNVARAGLVCYGLSPLSSARAGKITLRPALTFTSTLAQIKMLKKGDIVGYNRTYRCASDMTVGLVPAGYYDGVDRRLSNVGVISVEGVECPILGRVSMNMTVIGLDGVRNPRLGQKATIYSNDPSAGNSLASAAARCNTIPYDLLVHLAESIRREVVE